MLFVRSIVIDDKGRVLGGNVRTRAIQAIFKLSESERQSFFETNKSLIEASSLPTEKKMTAIEQAATFLIKRKIPIVRSNFTDLQEQEFIIKDNSNFGEWDFDILANDWTDFDLNEWGVNIPSWTDENEYMKEVDNSKSAEVVEDNFETPTIEQVKTDIVRGDLFELRGEGVTHRLLCGDSTLREDVEKLMNGEKANLYITDPPYGVSYADKNAFLNKFAKGYRIQTEIKNDHLSISDSAILWEKCFIEANEVMSDKASYYIFSAQGVDLLMMMMMIDKVFQLKHSLIWVKNNHVLGRCDYSYKHEPILFGWKKKGTHEFFGGFKTSVFDFKKLQKNDLHPTMKPIELIAELINNSSKEGFNILDSFLGSGSTMVAAHQMKRNCYGIELDQRYCQVIIDRMKKLDPALKIFKNGQELT